MTDKATSDLWWKNAVIYCADVATWADSDGDGVGDLAGLTRRLDYLAGLGVTTLWLMPFYPSPLGDDGYDITDYYAVDPRFGTLGDFVEMIRTADNLGIRVLVDLVLSHTSREHPWFQQRHRLYGRGIRRRLAPMLGHDQQRIRLALALMMALPPGPPGPWRPRAPAPSRPGDHARALRVPLAAAAPRTGVGLTVA